MNTVMRKLSCVAILGVCVLLSQRGGDAQAQGNAETGAKLYQGQNCKECHGDKGKGDGFIIPMLKVKVEMHDWTDKATMAGFTDEYLIEITAKGGEAVGKSPAMLSYADKLNAQQIKDIVAYIRSLAH
jgi:mono/diheme cytochrome c family protein